MTLCSRCSANRLGPTFCGSLAARCDGDSSYRAPDMFVHWSCIIMFLHGVFRPGVPCSFSFPCCEFATLFPVDRRLHRIRA